MHINFRSDGSVERSYLSGDYVAYDFQSCQHHWTLNQTKQIIQSPGYPGYDNNTFCYWVITGTYGTTISLRVRRLDLDTQGKSFLAVYNGVPPGFSLLGKYFGTSMPALIRSMGLSMFIVFQSEGSVAGTGFDGTIQSNCLPFYYGDDDCSNLCSCIQTNAYSCDNLHGTCSCVPGWTTSDCSVDVNECLITNTCTRTETCINTPGSYICQPDCNKEFTDSGTIETKEFPNISLNRARCIFTITGSVGNVVTLMISMEDFQLLESRNCEMDSLEIYDNQMITSQLIGKYCGTRIPHIIRTTNSTLILKLTTAEWHSRRGFRGQIYIHPCPAFTWGTTCEFSCTCDQSKTDYCDNTNGICMCKKGWVGDGCSDDDNECRFSRCSENEICENTPGAFTCTCKDGFTKNATGHCASSRTSCTSKFKESCSHSCYHDNVTGTDSCSCPDGLELRKTNKTRHVCVLPYYPYGQSAGDIDISTSYNKFNKRDIYWNRHPILFTSPVPFGDSLKTEAYVYSTGIISFENIDVSEEPDLQAAKDDQIDLISPFWAKTDATRGQIFYQLYEKCDASKFNERNPTTSSSFKNKVMERAAADVKKFEGFYDFDVTLALVVTWQDIGQPDQRQVQSNTFQAVVISGYRQESSSDLSFLDEQTSYIIYIYQKGKMKWPFKPGRKTEIGFVASPYSTINTIHVTGRTFNVSDENYLETVMFEVSRDSSSVQKCNRHVCKNSHLINNAVYLREIQELYDCPCSVGQLGLQWNLFEKRGPDIYCYAISPVAKNRLLASNPRNKLCCYNWNQPPVESSWQTWAESMAQSSFLHKTANAGHILVGDQHWFKGVQENIDAHQWCCKDTHDSKMCDRFNLIYPDLPCSYDVPFVPASLLGDPHIITFDNKSYTINVLGEYILMDIPSVNFILQGRTGRVHSSSGVLTNATVFIAFAAKEKNNARFQIELSVNKTSMVILVDGLNYTEDFYKNVTFRLTTKTIDVSRDNRFNKTKIAALFPSNVIVEVNVGVDCLELNLEVDKDLRGKTRGLLGNFNGNIDDEFLLPNGTVLSANLTEEQIYRDFAPNYQVTSATSVFTYANGMNTDSYTQPGFMPVFRSSLNASAELLQMATEFCGGNHEMCIYDYLVTEEVSFAENTKTTQALSVASRKTLENNLPNITVVEGSAAYINSRWLVVEGVPNTLSFNATDADDDLLIFLLDGNPRGVSLDQNSGVLTYTPNSLEPVKIAVRVKDTKNGYSPFLYLSIIICPHCNNHGSCDLNNTRKIEYADGLVHVLKCACHPAYAGEFCRDEKDACKSKPCSTGQICTDLTAAQQGNSSISHVCGPCPVGFEDLNGRCIDIDECNGTTVCEQICSNTEGSFECDCHDGFVPSFMDLRTCLVKNCSNRCLPEKTLYCDEPISQCVCKVGITSDDCSLVESCLSNPCPNNLQCVQKGNSYQCVCRNGLPQNSENRCIDCNRTLTETSGKLMSTNYPANYPDQSYCTWTIVSGEANAIITLNITDFEMEGCDFDYIEIYDGINSSADVIGQYCEEIPKSVVSTGNAMHIIFMSDSTVNFRGFIASYVAETQCRIKKCSHNCQVVTSNPRVEMCVCPPWTRLNPDNDSECLVMNACNTTVNNNSGYIVSPGYPQNYPANVTCSWYIPVTSRSAITLSFSDLDMESGGAECPYDNISVHDGSSSSGTLLVKLCEVGIPLDVMLTTDTGVFIVFKSDSSLSGRGFKMEVAVQAANNALFT